MAHVPLAQTSTGTLADEAAASASRRCVAVPNVCFEAEQLLLHGPEAEAALVPLMALLNGTRDPSDAFSLLRPYMRPTALVARPGVPYEYLPIAVGAKRAGKRRGRFLVRHTPSAPAAADWAEEPEEALAFFTSWSNSFTEIFSRAVVRIYEFATARAQHVAASRRKLHLIPAMWGSTWGPDYAQTWLAPFTAYPVHPLALTPPRELVKKIWRTLASKEEYERYLQLSANMFSTRATPRCFRRATVCDFTPMPARPLPWSTVQAAARFHMRETKDSATLGRFKDVQRFRLLDCEGAECALQVTFADRKGRRKLHNLHELVEACNRWPVPPLLREATRVMRLNCTAWDFGRGLRASLPTLSRTDVMVAPHGADLINGFALHAGATLIEVQPVFQKGCPCDMYRRMFTREGPAVFNYQFVSTNASYAVSDEPRKYHTYNSDLVIPWPVLARGFERVLSTNGKSARFKFRRFQY